MNYFIALFVLFTLALSQDTTGGVVKADCSKEGACGVNIAATTVMCTDPVTQIKTPLQYQCVNSPKDPSVCIWYTSGCPVSVCTCSKDQMPSGTNYICKDDPTKVGGPVCNPVDCTWSVVECVPYTEKTGYCPLVIPKDNTFCAATTYGTCSSDSECEGTKKCCQNDCSGLSCQDPNPVLVRPGVCPTVKEGEFGICGIACKDDSECADKQKCCPNGCNSAGSACVNVFDPATSDTCEVSECTDPKPVTFASTICPDGKNIQGPFCEPQWVSDPSGATDALIRKCSWGFHPCPTVLPDVHQGSCPIFKQSEICAAALLDQCKSDSDCILSNKCCFDGCYMVCCDSVVDNTCTVTGYKDYYCLDTATAEATATTTNSADTSILPGDDCWYRCQQNSLCSYDPDTTKCDRDEEYYKCVADCEANPDPTPVDPICGSKTSCDCLAETENKCGWCQVKAYTSSDDGTSTDPYVWGYCASPFGANKCSATYSSNGNEGSWCTVAPTECIDDYSVDPAIKDTSSFFSEQYEKYKQYFNDINTGKLTETAVQKVVDTCKEGCDFTIKTILPAVANSDGTTGSVSSIVEVHTCDKTLEDIGKCILKGFSSTAGIPESSFKDCTLKPYTVSAGTSLKRATTSGTYLQSATVDAATTDNTSENSAGTLAPIWMMLCAIFLFFRM